jgi:predicted Zn finger-like uncharacterized protein
MITFSCPGCQATFRLPDEMAGKSARCSKCNHRFSVPGGAAPAAAPGVSAAAARTSAPAVGAPAIGAPAVAPPKSAPAPRPVAAAAAAMPAVAMPAAAAPLKKVALNPVPEVLEAEIVDDEPPRPAKRPEPVYDDVEVADDLDDRPRSRRAARRVDEVDEVEEYDDRDEFDDDRPRRRRRAKSGGSLGWILATLGGVSMVLMIIFFIMMIVAGGSGGGGGGAPIVNPQIVNGMYQDNNNLTRGDPQDRMFFRSRAKEYRIEMQQGKTYVIDLESAAFDAWLRVLDANGTILFQNDDFNGLNSRIVFTPNQTATYTIVTTSLDGRIGPYRLTVREQNFGVK